MKNIKKYIKTKIKDKELAEKITNMVTCEKQCVSFDHTDVKAMLGRAKELNLICGNEENITEMIKKNGSPEKVKDVMMMVEAKEIKMDDVNSIGEEVTENIDWEDVEIIWSARENKRLTKKRISVVLAY